MNLALLPFRPSALGVVRLQGAFAVSQVEGIVRVGLNSVIDVPTFPLRQEGASGPDVTHHVCAAPACRQFL